MSPEVLAIASVFVMLGLLFLGLPIFLVLSLMGFLGILYLIGPGAALSLFGTIPYVKIGNFVMVTLPLFILMGEVVFESGIGRDAFVFTQSLVGRLPGGLALATIGACAFFAAACGSSLAAAAAMGSIAIPEMRRHNYDSRLAAGVVAAGGTLGILIPPSVPFIIYGMLTETSIGDLFIAGILPGIILTILLMLAVVLIVKIRPSFVQGTKRPPLASSVTGPSVPASSVAVPSAVAASAADQRLGFKNILRSSGGVLPIVLIFVVVIGSMYTGVCTPTEAAAVGAFAAIITAMGMRRLSWPAFKTALRATLNITCMVFAIVMGAMIFNRFLATSNLPQLLSDVVGGLQVNRGIFILGITVMYLILGMVLDALAMIVITIPVVLPAIQALGFDVIWFGVIIVIVMEMAYITPPVGMNIFVLKGVVEDISMADMFRGTLMFLPCHLLLIVILTIFPSLPMLLLPK